MRRRNLGVHEKTNVVAPCLWNNRSPTRAFNKNHFAHIALSKKP